MCDQTISVAVFSLSYGDYHIVSSLVKM